MNPQLTQAAAAAMLAALGTLANGGSLNLYTGTQPVNADTAISTQVQLITFPLAATAFGGASAGVMGANTIAPAYAIASGTATWFRILESDGATAVMDGSVGVSGADLNLASTSITSGDILAITGFTISLPLGS